MIYPVPDPSLPFLRSDEMGGFLVWAEFTAHFIDLRERFGGSAVTPA